MKINTELAGRQVRFFPYAADWLVLQHADRDEYVIQPRKAARGEQRFDSPHRLCSKCGDPIETERANVSIWDPSDPSGKSRTERINERTLRHRGEVLVLCESCDSKYRFKPWLHLDSARRERRERVVRQIFDDTFSASAEGDPDEFPD